MMRVQQQQQQQQRVIFHQQQNVQPQSALSTQLTNLRRSPSPSRKDDQTTKNT
jgi:hypothetical protein